MLRGLVMTCVILLSFVVQAQPPIGGPPPCWPPPCIPIDGGVSALLAVGALFGGRQAWKLRQLRSKNR